MRRLLALPLILLAAPSAADDLKASDPVKLDITIYRDPYRDSGSIELDNLGGFAVITETRRVTIPAGEHRLRFEGVVDGIIPESAIVTGLPGGVIEKNQDADLLSPSALLRAARGRTISLTRTDPATGKRKSSAATLISAGPDGVVFQSEGGFETLRCSGYPETFRYSTGMSGLPGKPTLSVQTNSRRTVAATVTLTYLAENFDWGVNYRLHFNADRQTFDFGGWITLANGNAGSLPETDLKIVAGRLNREEYERFVDERPDPIAKCWPMQKTSDPAPPGPPYQLVRPYLPVYVDNADYYGQIVVTAQRRRESLQNSPLAISAYGADSLASEQLGDLKLYALPWRTTVAANQMKQVRLFDRRGLRGDPVFVVRVNVEDQSTSGNWEQARLELHSRNDKQHGLGLPLPAGRVQTEQAQFGRSMLIDESETSDTALNEKLRFSMGEANDVTYRLTTISVIQRGDKQIFNQQIEVTNALPYGIVLEVNPYRSEAAIENSSSPQIQEDGRKFWRLNLPANDKATLTFTAVSG